MSMSTNGPFTTSQKIIGAPVSAMNASAHNFTPSNPVEGVNKIETYSTKRRPMAANPVAHGAEPEPVVVNIVQSQPPLRQQSLQKPES